MVGQQPPRRGPAVRLHRQSHPNNAQKRRNDHLRVEVELLSRPPMCVEDSVGRTVCHNVVDDAVTEMLICRSDAAAATGAIVAQR